MSKKSYEEYKQQRIDNNREWKQKRFDEILEKDGSLENTDMMPFLEGLTQDEKEMGCLIFLVTRQQRGDSPAKILLSLRGEG